MLCPLTLIHRKRSRDDLQQSLSLRVLLLWRSGSGGLRFALLGALGILVAEIPFFFFLVSSLIWISMYSIAKAKTANSLWAALGYGI